MFCSSVAAVSNFHHTAPLDASIPEHFIVDPRVSGRTGYARSKWVGEAICAEAHKSTRLRGRISVARVGQLSGTTDTGVWSKSEAYPLLLSSAKVTGVLPDLKHEILNWLPVDTAAKAFIEASLSPPGDGTSVGSTASRTKSRSDAEVQEMPVHHVLNPDMTVRWSDLVRWLAPHAEFKVVPMDEWLAKLTALQDDDRTKNHPALRLLEFWRKAYGSVPGDVGACTRDDEEEQGQGKQAAEVLKGEARYQMEETFQVMPVLESASGLMDETYVLRLWDWVQAEL